MAGCAAAAFALNIYLTLHFTDRQPREPVTAQGFIYAMNDHGILSYLTAAQVDELTILLITSIVLILAAVALIAPLTRKKQAWEKYAPPEPGSFVYFGFSFVLSALGLWFTIEQIASFLVQRGFISTFGVW